MIRLKMRVIDWLRRKKVIHLYNFNKNTDFIIIGLANGGMVEYRSLGTWRANFQLRLEIKRLYF